MGEEKELETRGEEKKGGGWGGSGGEEGEKQFPSALPAPRRWEWGCAGDAAGAASPSGGDGVAPWQRVGSFGMLSVCGWV